MSRDILARHLRQGFLATAKVKANRIGTKQNHGISYLNTNKNI